MSEVAERIAAWESEGLIDRATADRLRGAESARLATESPGAPARVTDVTEIGASTHPEGGSQVGATFGPSVTIPEVFGYLGTGFLLAAWSAWAGRGNEGDGTLRAGLAALLAAGVLIALGAVLRRGEARGSRAAGAAFLVAVAYAGVGVTALAGATSLTPEQAGVIGAAAALALALVLRRLHPAVLTQVGLLAAITALAAAVMIWVQAAFLPSPTYAYDDLGNASPLTAGADPRVLVVASAVWWLCCAVVIGLIGLIEARAAEAGDEAAARRAALSRLWAGMVAVIGLATAVTRSDIDPAGGDYQRVVAPWLGELSLVVLSLILLERAFRRDATAYVYAAALGLIIALSDFNLNYLSDTTEVALAIEGAILLGVGFGADRLRRRIGRSRSDAGPSGPPPAGVDAMGTTAAAHEETAAPEP